MARKEAHELRRQGRADLVVMLVRKRIIPSMTAEDWCDVADVTKDDIAEAIARWKWGATHRTEPGVRAPRMLYNERAGQIVAWLTDQGGKATSASGQGLTAALCQHMNMVPQSVSTVLRKMEDDGMIARDRVGKRTYAIWIPSLP